MCDEVQWIKDSIVNEQFGSKFVWTFVKNPREYVSKRIEQT